VCRAPIVARSAQLARVADVAARTADDSSSGATAGSQPGMMGDTAIGSGDAMVSDQKPRRLKLNLELTGDGRVRDVDTGTVYDPVAAAEALVWRQQGGKHRPEVFDPRIHMPLHCYVVWAAGHEPYFSVLAFAISKHPKSYMAYFRGYQNPMRYLELAGLRYWSSAIHGAQMVNRCTLDSVEAPRRVADGARPICWQQWGAEEAYLPQGGGWSAEYRAKHPEMFGPDAPPPCAHGVTFVGDRVKHMSSKRYGTVLSIDSGPKAISVRWDDGKESVVGPHGLRTQCCLPGESITAAASGARSHEVRVSAESHRTSAAVRPDAKANPPGGTASAADLHREFWIQFQRYLRNKRSPVRITKTPSKSIGETAPGPGTFLLVPWNVVKGESGVWVRATGSSAAALIDRISEQHRDRVEAQLTALGEVVWLPGDDRGSVLSLRRPSSVASRATWPELNGWLAGALETLHVALEEINER
jgi:hypothetical protein